jgi:3-isopropylmalate/(R)-2-methylmalate dehydratase large subunit
MGSTIIEKIMAAKSGFDAKSVKPGDTVWIDLDVRSARDFGGANVVGHLLREFPDQPLAEAKKTFFTFDCVAPANNIPYANNQQICREFAWKHSIRIFDVNRGIGSHVMIEEGLALPAGTVVGADSHMNILGAVGCFGQGMGDNDIAFAMKTGRTWFEVPETIRIVIKGTLPAGRNLTARDLTEKVVGTLGASGALGCAIEYYGEAIEALELPGRITLASMATEMGAIISFIPPSGEIMEYCRKRAGQELAPIFADSDAVYHQTIEIEASNLEPLISKPSKPENVVRVAEVAGQKIHSVFIGSCTNGRFEDYYAVADYVAGRKVAPRVMAKITPATLEVYGKLLESGVLRRLFEAGFIVSHPGCGGCASGQLGMTGKGEVQVSTSNRNFAGKQGAGLTYLASPLTAAACAIAGEITVP